MSAYAIESPLRAPVADVFRERFRHEPLEVFAPGRINLIGEHTDYNEGYVLPGATQLGIHFAVALNGSRQINLLARDLDASASFNVDQLAPSAQTPWANYLTGICAMLQQAGYEIPGFDCVFGGDLPSGAGMSSSAALECGLGLALDRLLDLRLPRLELARLAQQAEHSFVGVKCGLMDQFACLFGQEGHFVKLDCRTLQYEYFALNNPAYGLLVLDTQVKHSLAASEYNQRRKEVEAGIRRLQQYYPEVVSLRDVTLEMLREHREEFNPMIYKRCVYVVEENQRVLDACEALSQNDYARVGELMYLSHEGLEFDYEVSCKELDMLAHAARKDKRITGARMIGGGFGGSVLALVPSEEAEAVALSLSDIYESAFGTRPRSFLARLEGGTHVVEH
jgi:galactokinase